MIKTNIADLRNNLSELLTAVEKGEEVQIQKRNIPIARILSIKTPTANKTSLGLGKGTAKIKGDLTQSVMQNDWEMLE